MKRCVFILLLTASMLLNTSCQREVSADIVLRNFCASYGCPVGTVYSSEEKETSPSYLGTQLLFRLYGVEDPPLYQSMAVMLFADMDTLVECGVFVVRGGAGKLDDIVRTEEMFSYRIRQISLLFSQKTGQIYRYGDVIVYTVVEDKEKAERILCRLL